MAKFTDRLAHAWNAFTQPEVEKTIHYGGQTFGRPDRNLMHISNEQSIVGTIYNKIATDVAAIDMKHVRVDENDRFVEEIQSGLNRCLSLEANIDQSGRALIQDAVQTMFDEGTAVIVPIDTSLNPMETGGYDINNMRVGKIVKWLPQHVTVSVYNEKSGKREDITLPKKMVAIIDNPFYAVMNEPNSTLKRLTRKINMLDRQDAKMTSGKLDLIIQLPYAIKTEAKKKQADERKKDIEVQLQNSTHGIAYIDAAEKITQLNRPAENTLLEQIDSLTNQLYAQLGLTESVFNGTANEAEMLNYYNRSIEPILTTIAESMKRKFLTRTAITQGQSIKFFRDPFKLVPVKELAEIADKFTRNEIITSNEVRAIIGYKPSTDPEADELRNKNLNKADNVSEGQNGIKEVEDEPE